MATVVLTVAGGLIGGPIGAAIGAAAGGVIDREVLLHPRGREGPRLNELRVQTSSYGTQIPKLFGTMRVAGSVIWATDLIEHRGTASAGKGRGSTTPYSYTASFAVALSTRPILSIGRIWADGKLLRGAGGDWKSRTGAFRLHPGDEDQAADPLIVAAEGVGQAPAHRGIAYAVFEDLELGDFGNRIPSLSFEVTADDDAVAIGSILGELGGGAIAGGDGGAMLGGFSAYGSNVRAVAETLTGAAGGWFRADDEALRLMAGSGEAVALADPGVRVGAGAGRTRTIAAADAAPRIFAISHYDPARDYQGGVQRAVRPGAGNREMRLELAAAIHAVPAKAMAETALARLDLERERRGLALGWDQLALRPGERVTIADLPGEWRIDRWTLEKMALKLECLRVAPAATPVAASAGRVAGAADLVSGATVLHAFALPALDDVAATVPRIGIAAAGTGPGWRGAALLMRVDDGGHWSAAGATAPPAVLGTIVVPPGPASAAIEDRTHRLDVQLAHAGMALGDADAAAIDAGANLAMVGNELIQFARAEPLGAARWRLSGLWRGRRATEAAIGTQEAGDRFVLLDAETLAVREVVSAAIGATVRVIAQGVGDGDEGVEATAVLDGSGIVPPAPVHLTARLLESGATQLCWMRRSRMGWQWRDGVDAPLGEERELYRVTLTRSDGASRVEEVAAPMCLIPAAERAGPLTVEVRQVGALGLSAAATRILPAIGAIE